MHERGVVMKWMARVALVVAAALPACPSDGGDGACGVAGGTQLCVCAGGAVGAQRCGIDGAWGVCDCRSGDDVDEGDSDTTPSDIDVQAEVGSDVDVTATSDDIADVTATSDDIADVTATSNDVEVEDAPAEVTLAPCDFHTVPAVPHRFENNGGGSASLMIMGEDVWVQVIWGESLSVPGTFPLSLPGAEVGGFFGCTQCMLVRSGCATGGCDHLYMAESGAIRVTSLDLDRLSLSGLFDEVRLVEVALGSDTDTVSVIPGGGVWCLDDVAIDAPPACRSDDDCAAPRARCDEDASVNLDSCVGCLSSFDCGGDTPVCDTAEGACAPAPTCAGDDANEPDDGPSQATPITLGSVTSGVACSASFERDYFTFTLGATRDVEIGLTWTSGFLSLGGLTTADGAPVDDSYGTQDIAQRTSSFGYEGLAPGTYFVWVFGAVTGPYQLTLDGL